MPHVPLVWKNHAAINIPALTKMIMTMLKRDTTAKVGNKSKRLKAGWDNDHLLKVLELYIRSPWASVGGMPSMTHIFDLSASS